MIDDLLSNLSIARKVLSTGRTVLKLDIHAQLLCSPSIARKIFEIQYTYSEGKIVIRSKSVVFYKSRFMDIRTISVERIAVSRAVPWRCARFRGNTARGTSHASALRAVLLHRVLLHRVVGTVARRAVLLHGTAQSGSGTAA